MGVGKERGGGHPVGAGEGQQGVRAHVAAAEKALEGNDQHIYLHYITITVVDSIVHTFKIFNTYAIIKLC